MKQWKETGGVCTNLLKNIITSGSQTDEHLD